MSTWKVWTDASTIHGVCAGGAWIIEKDGRIEEKHSIDLFHCGHPLCVEDSYSAELYTLLTCVRRCVRLTDGERVHFFTDCQDIVNNLLQRRTPLRQEHAAWIVSLHDRMKHLPGSRVVWIPREKNQAADYLSKLQSGRLREKETVLYRLNESGAVERLNSDPHLRRVFSDVRNGKTRKVLR